VSERNDPTARAVPPGSLKAAAHSFDPCHSGCVAARPGGGSCMKSRERWAVALVGALVAALGGGCTATGWEQGLEAPRWVQGLEAPRWVKKALEPVPPRHGESRYVGQRYEDKPHGTELSPARTGRSTPARGVTASNTAAGSTAGGTAISTRAASSTASSRGQGSSPAQTATSTKAAGPQACPTARAARSGPTVASTKAVSQRA
jgi:hypothetical protein